MENNLIFQPYGKDEFYFNFLATEDGNWFFGPCDLKNFDKIHKDSIIHTYIKLKCKNPKYSKHILAKDFIIHKETKLLSVNNRKKISGLNEIYIFIVYNSEENFMFMEYTPDYDEYMFIKENFNILTSFIIIGDSVSVVRENLGTGIGAPKDAIMKAIGEMKNEID